MPREWETRCWYCGSTDLEPDEKGIRCRKCGTTHTVIHNISPSPLALKKDPLASSYGDTHGLSGSPSDSYLKEAAKRRAAAVSNSNTTSK